jgi:hypothetical protein
MTTPFNPTELARKDQPDAAGRWLAYIGEEFYEADVREYAPGCFEAMIHGYATGWNPTVLFIGHFTDWQPDRRPSRSITEAERGGVEA